MRWLWLVMSLVVPIIYLATLWPDRASVERARLVRGGTVQTPNNRAVDVDFLLGDLFRPKAWRKDIGFDLVGVSCFFNPLEISSSQVLPANPLLVGAIRASLRDSAEVVTLVANIFRALDESREAASCFAVSAGAGTCEGDPIVPCVWKSFPGSDMEQLHGVKFIAALPLFDPDMFLEHRTESELHDGLRENVIRVTRRLIETEASTGDCARLVRTIGLAANGSTSHRGGDSRAFLSFSEGFLATIEAVQKSRPMGKLDRVFLVAYDEHSGVFRGDAISALQKSVFYLRFKSISEGGSSTVAAGVLAVLMFLLTASVYRNAGRIWRNNNRFAFITTVVAVSGLATGICWGVTGALMAALPPRSFHFAIIWLLGSIALIDLLLFVLAKRIRIGGRAL